MGLCLTGWACDAFIRQRLEKQMDQELAKSIEKPPVTPPVTLTIAAASSLEPPLRELAAAFQPTENARINFSFAASGTLARQLENGAPFDIFCAADATTIKNLQAKELLSGQPRTVARGQLVLYWQNTSYQFTNLADLNNLTLPTIKHIAIANPATAPYGQAAQQLLEKLNLWEKLQAKLVYGESVNNARQYVRSGNAEVAFMARSLVLPSEAHLILPLELYQPLNQVVAVTAIARQTLLAQQFVDFLTSDRGQKIFANYGYAPPEK
jgi:molybdate transport system substrate-binding protein